MSKLLALPTNIRLGWRGLPGTNTLVYYEHSSITTAKSFITSGPISDFLLIAFNPIFPDPDHGPIGQRDQRQKPVGQGLPAGARHRPYKTFLAVNDRIS